MRHKFITYERRNIFYADARGMNSDEILKDLKELRAYLTDLKKHRLLILNDITGCSLTKEIRKYQEESLLLLKDKIEKIAIIGVDGFQKKLIDIIMYFSRDKIKIKIFKNYDDAKKWLVDKNS